MDVWFGWIHRGVKKMNRKHFCGHVFCCCTDSAEMACAPCAVLSIAACIMETQKKTTHCKWKEKRMQHYCTRRKSQRPLSYTLIGLNDDCACAKNATGFCLPFFGEVPLLALCVCKNIFRILSGNWTQLKIYGRCSLQNVTQSQCLFWHEKEKLVSQILCFDALH